MVVLYPETIDPNDLCWRYLVLYNLESLIKKLLTTVSTLASSSFLGSLGSLPDTRSIPSALV